MTDTSPRPEGQVADAPPGNWVDRRAPRRARPYLRLSRADRPIGTWLLLIPCLWSILLAALSDQSFGAADLWLVLACGLGAWLMRGAGCTWNDITDRHLDAKVARTRSRPLPSGQVTVRGAVFWMIGQCLAGLLVLLTFNGVAILLGVAALLPVAIYPFAKRFTWWPQVFLGIAFNWGALLGWVAHTGSLHWAAVALYAAGMAWTLFYDTIYALQDVEDDALIGVKSTARLFGDANRRWLFGFLAATVALMSLAIALAATPETNILALSIALAGVWAFGWHMVWQMTRLRTDDPASCLAVFHSNRDAGLIPVLFLAASLMA